MQARAVVRRSRYGGTTLVPLVLATSSAAADTWNGGTGDWFDTGNWTDGSVPTGTDVVEIDAGEAQVEATGAISRDLQVGRFATASLTISGSGALTSEAIQLGTFIGSAGTVTVTGSGSSWDGRLLLIGNGGTGSLTVSGGGSVTNSSIRIGGDTTGIGTLTVTGSGSSWTGTASLTIGAAGRGTLDLLDGGVVSVGTTLTIARDASSSGNVKVGSGGAAGILDAATVTGGAGAATLDFDHDEAVYFFTRDGTVDGDAIAITGSVAVNHLGSGTTVLTGSNSYSGTTTISAGTLSVATDGNLGTGTVTLAGGTLAVTGTTAIDNPVTLGVGGGTVSASGADSSLTGTLSGAGTLTKAGPGTLTLSGTGGHSGGTAVSAGILTVNGALTDAANAVSVASGAALAGSGSIAGAVGVAAGGALTPGDGVGRISTGSLTLAPGSTAGFEIDGTAAGTQYDQVAVAGTVDVSGAMLTTSFGFASTAGDSFILVDNDGVDPVTGTFAGLAEGATLASGGRTYRIAYAAGDGNDVTLTDVAPALPPDGGSGSGDSPLSQSGTAGADLLVGGAGNDTIHCLAGDDVASGAGGADLIYGNQDADTLWGGGGVDTVYGGQGADLVYGNQAADILYGNRGGDILFGGQHADTIFGGQDADLVYGNLDDDRLLGNLGEDTLYGGQGNDTLEGGGGGDALIGNLGADRFAFGSGDGADTIADFSASEGDRIVIAAGVNGTGISSASDLLVRLFVDAGGKAALDLGGGNVVTLAGVAPGSATADWFLVV